MKRKSLGMTKSQILEGQSKRIQMHTYTKADTLLLKIMQVFKLISLLKSLICDSEHLWLAIWGSLTQIARVLFPSSGDKIEQTIHAVKLI